MTISPKTYAQSLTYVDVTNVIRDYWHLRMALWMIKNADTLTYAQHLASNILKETPNHGSVT